MFSSAPAATKYYRHKDIPQDDAYYSVEFGINESQPVYQFKLWHSERTPHFFLLKETSALAAQLKVGEMISMKYYCSNPIRNIEQHETRIDAIVKETKGRFQGHYRITLDILDNDMAKSLQATGTGY
jgi:hypothetical protein